MRMLNGLPRVVAAYRQECREVLAAWMLVASVFLNALGGCDRPRKIDPITSEGLRIKDVYWELNYQTYQAPTSAVDVRSIVIAVRDKALRDGEQNPFICTLNGAPYAINADSALWVAAAKRGSAKLPELAIVSKQPVTDPGGRQVLIGVGFDGLPVTLDVAKSPAWVARSVTVDGD